MGNGQYSHDAHRALLDKRSGASAQEIFAQTSCHPLMDPKGVRARESRDGADHPSSLGIVFALDVTGSMGHIPVLMATKVLPSFMRILSHVKVPDPQLLFVAVGDAYADKAPLQVGQFESTAELIDQWLTRCFLESGGGDAPESYDLALYFLATHTSMDCWEKRKKRGYLFMTGDQESHPKLKKAAVEKWVGDRLDDDLTTAEIVAELQKTFVPFFVIPDPGRRRTCEKFWRGHFGDHVLCLESPEDVCLVAAGAVALSEKVVPDLAALGDVLSEAGTPKAAVDTSMRALRSFAEVVR